jgi:hypothetical protein
MVWKKETPLHTSHQGFVVILADHGRAHFFLRLKRGVGGFIEVINIIIRIPSDVRPKGLRKRDKSPAIISITVGSIISVFFLHVL